MSNDLIQLQSGALDVTQAVAHVTDGRAGGIDVFLGTTRAEMSPEHQGLVALDYEAYQEMALKELTGLAADARSRFPIIKLAIMHRLGRVRVTEPSVIIAVSCPHRAESFEACRFLIDGLKAKVPIWKKEVWSDGTGSWVHPEES